VIRRAALLLLELAAALVAGTVVLSGLALWRLSQGPVELDFLGPLIQAELVRQGEGQGVRVAVGEVEISWGGFEEPLRLRARRLEAEGGDGAGGLPARIVAVPEMGVDLDVASLIRGEVSPTEFELVRPRVFVTRLETGRWVLDVRPTAAAADQGPGLGEALTDAILSPPDPSRPFGRLRRLSISDAEIVVDDLMAGFQWDATGADLVLERTETGLRAEIAASVRIGGTVATLAGGAVHDRQAGRTAADLHTSAIPLADLAAVAPELAVLGRLGWTVGADLYLELDERLALRTATASVARRDGEGRLSASIGAPQPDGSRRLEAWLEDVRMPALAPLLGGPDALDWLDIRVDGQAGLRLEADGTLGRGRASLRGGAGLIALPDGSMEPLPTRSVLLDLSFDPTSRLLELERLDADLDGPRLSADGWAVLLPRERRVEWLLAASVRDLPLATALRHWPRTALQKTRGWASERLSGGTADEAAVLLTGDLALDGAPQPRARVDRVSGTIDFRGLDVRYLSTMPPAEGVAGAMRFDRRAVEVRTRPGARIAGATAGEASIAFDRSDDGAVRASASIPLAGPVREILRIADHPPLRLLASGDLTPERFGGTAEGVLEMEFPLRDGLRPEDVVFRVEGTGRDLSMSRAAPGIDLTGGRFALSADGDGFRIGGRGALNGVPAGIVVSERLGDGRPDGVVEIEADLTPEALARLRLPVPPRMEGSVAARATIRQTGPDRREVEAEADLGPATLEIPEAGWIKPAGVPGTLRIAAPVVRDRVGTVTILEAEAPGLSAVGRVEPTPDGRGASSVSFERLSLGGSSGRLEAARTEAGGWRVRADGDVLDLGPTLERMRAGVDEPGPDIDAALEFGRVLLGGERELRSAVAVVSSRGGRVRRAEVAATAGGARLLLDAAPDGDGVAYRIETADLGRALAGLGFGDRVRGGRAVIAGRHDQDRPAGARTTGRIEVEDAHAVRQPVLARVLNALSLTGLGDLLSSDGISFEEARADFVRDRDGIRIYDGRAWGGSLGITGQGTLDAAGGRVELGGTVVPLYGVNRVIGAVPILGDILTGGDGQGLLAANWRVSGPSDAPVVSVDAASFLAPGFLRRLFFPTPAGELAEETEDR